MPSAGAADEIGKVIVDIGLMIADIDDRGSELGQRREEGPFDLAGRTCSHRVAQFEKIAIQQDDVGRLVGSDARFDGREKLADALIGRMQVGDDDCTQGHVLRHDRRCRHHQRQHGGAGHKLQHIAAFA